MVQYRELSLQDFNLIKSSELVVYVKHWKDPYFFIYKSYSEFSNDAFKEIPSWLWLKDVGAFRMHYLDLSLLFKISDYYNYKVFFDFNVKDKLKELKEHYLNLKKYKTELVVKLDCVKRPFRQYQLLGSQFMYFSKKCLNADAMGSGKTTQTIGAILLNKISNKPYKTLIIVPTSLKGSWYNEILQVTDFLKPLVLDSNMEKRFAQYKALKDEDVLITSYDSFMRDYTEINEYFKPNILVIDEAHRLTSRTNKITQILIGGKLIKKNYLVMTDPHSIYLLTGTPITNKLEDLYPILKIIDPGLFIWTAFGNRYLVYETHQKWNYTGGIKRATQYRTLEGYRNEMELKKKLDFFMIRRKKENILPELPERIYELKEIELSKEEQLIYDKLKNEWKTFITSKQISIADQMSWMLRAQQIVDSLELLDPENKKSSKLEELKQIIKDHAPHRKIVVFSRFKTMTTILERELKEYNPLHLNGDVSAEERTEMIHKFQTDPKYRVFIATIKAGGVGITLTAADMVILYDRWFTPSINFQAVDRLHRISQKNPVVVVNMRVKGTIEEHIEKIWLSKQTLVDKIVGDDAFVNKLTLQELETLI